MHGKATSVPMAEGLNFFLWINEKIPALIIFIYPAEKDGKCLTVVTLRHPRAWGDIKPPVARLDSPLLFVRSGEPGRQNLYCFT